MTKSKITVAQISKESGVSPATVSRVLNHRELVKEETVALVIDAMQKLGCPPETFKNVPPRVKPKIIVLCLPTLQNTFYNEIFEGAKASARAHNCYLVIYDTPVDANTLPDLCYFLERINASGLITLNKLTIDVIEKLSSLMPLVQCCEYNTESNCPSVSIDNVSAAQLATEHLITCGCNKIAFINGPRNYKYAIDRQKGFLTTMQEAELSILRNWIIQLPAIDFNMAYAAVCRLLNSESPPHAFFTVSDIYAMAVIRAAKRYHLNVPQDIMVIGFDNIAVSAMVSPSLTTISQPCTQMGYSACEMLIDSIMNPSSIPDSILFDTELIMRESTSVTIKNHSL